MTKIILDGQTWEKKDGIKKTLRVKMKHLYINGDLK